MSDLLVIDVRVKDGRGHVVLAGPARDPASATLVTLEFPLDHDMHGAYPEREARLVADAQAVLREASAALRER